LTHIPADYVSILKALYCRMTVRQVEESTTGGSSSSSSSMRTRWVGLDSIGWDDGGQSIRPILGAPNATEEAKKAARRQKHKQIEKLIAQQEREDRRKERAEAAAAAGKVYRPSVEDS